MYRYVCVVLNYSIRETAVLIMSEIVCILVFFVRLCVHVK